MDLNGRGKWFALMTATFLILLLALFACSNGSSTPSNGTPGITSSAALSGNVSVSGSSTVQPLAEKLANAFMSRYPGIKVIVQGGGSSVGIKAAHDGTVDIGTASRELTESDPELLTHIIARDGLAFIVHPANPVNSLTIEQLRDIYSGRITNWSQVGGDDRTVHVSAREEGSGTRTTFEDIIMDKDTRVVRNSILQSSNGALLRVVNSDPAAISFISFGYLDDTVKALAIDGVAPTGDNAQTGAYPLVRPLYFLTKNQPEGIVKIFIDYCTGNEAQSIISGEGYITVK